MSHHEITPKYLKQKRYSALKNDKICLQRKVKELRQATSKFTERNEMVRQNAASLTCYQQQSKGFVSYDGCSTLKSCKHTFDNYSNIGGLEELRRSVGDLAVEKEGAVPERTEEKIVSSHFKEKNSNLREKEAEREKADYRKKYEEAELNLKQKERDVDILKKENEFLKSEKDKLNREIEKLTKEWTSAKRAASDIEKKEIEIRKEYQKADEYLKEYEKEVKQLKNEKADATKRIQELEMYKNQEQLYQDWVEAELAKKEAEISSLKDNIKKLSSEKLRIMNDRDEMEKAKDDALTRLSKAAGAKLTQGNAAITDLSDINRPTKIAEKFSELYDNLWTDAYEELSDQGLDDLRVINILLQILKDAYQTCMQKEKVYDSTITEAVHCMPTMKHGVLDRASGSTSSTIQTNVQIRKAIVDIKLALGPTAGSKIAELYMPHLEESLRDSIPTFRCSSFPKTAEYGRQCAILCWLMRIRDPSVHIDFNFTTDSRFDGDVYRQYTNSGSMADYLVWPILYLHEGGPLLAKGVAQPK